MSATRGAPMPWDAIPDPLAPRALSRGGLEGSPELALSGGGPRRAPAVEAPREPSPTRAEHQRRVRLSLAVSAASWLGLLALLGPRAGLGRQLPVLAGASLAAVLGLTLATRWSRGLPPDVRALRGVVLGLPLAFAAVVVAHAGVSTWGDSSGVVACVALGALFALAPLGAIVVVLARALATAAALRGAALGAVAGLVGAVGIHAHCPREGLLHTLLGHGLPIVVCSALGALAGRLRGRA